MVINFCGFRRRVRPKLSSEKASEDESCGLIDKLLVAMKAKKLPEKKQLYTEDCKVITLEDLFASSPGLETKHDYMNTSGGETSMQKQSSRKIHPSFEGEIKNPILPVSKMRDQAASSSFCSTTRARAKKKVSFRSPEVAEVFVLCHSPEINILL